MSTRPSGARGSCSRRAAPPTVPATDRHGRGEEAPGTKRSTAAFPRRGENRMFEWLKGRKPAPQPRKGMPSPRLDEAEFKRRFRAQYQDPAFDALGPELDRVAAAAWDSYAHSRKSSRT